MGCVLLRLPVTPAFLSGSLLRGRQQELSKERGLEETGRYPLDIASAWWITWVLIALFSAESSRSLSAQVCTSDRVPV